MPLSFVIARYFAYAFAAVATAWLASFMALSAAINAGFVYEASWGPANVREVAEGLARDGVCGQQDVPTAYRYLILNKDGYVLMTDLDGTRLEDATEMARAALAADPGTVEIEGGGSGLTYAAFPLKGGGACALVSEYLLKGGGACALVSEYLRSGSRAISPACFPTRRTSCSS
ncbi:hypothetical protein DXA64_10280, partial [Collinsella sp. OF03-4AA]